MLCSLARLVGENGSVIAYANDIHLIGSPATVGLALSSLTQLSTPVEALSLDCRLSSLGLALSLGKTSILLGREANPQALETGLGSDLLTAHPPRCFYLPRRAYYLHRPRSPRHTDWI